ncbi:MAG: InlB B-repeat-containing protein [Bifidobacterium pseudocatenulatum]
MGFFTRLIAGLVAASTLGAGLAGTAGAVETNGAASDTTGAVTTTADDTGGRTVLNCRQSGEGATGPYADKFCWIDWSNLPLDSSGKPTPVRINVPGGHIDADASNTHTDNAALAAKDFTGSKWSRLTSAYKLTGNTALAFSGRMGRQDPAASVTFSNVTPSADRTDTGVNVLKDFRLAFGDAEVMSGGVLQGHDVYEQTDIESDKTLEKLGMIGSGDPNQSYSKANTGYGTTHVTLAGGPKGATDDANKDSKGAAVVGAKQASRFKVSFGQVNQHWDGWGSAIAVGVYMPYLTAYPLTYDKNASDAAGEVPSNQRGKENTTQPAKTKTNGTVKTVADTNASLPDHLVNGDFSVNYHDQWKDSFGGWTSIDPNAGKTLHATSLPSGSSWKWTAINGWDKSKFGWTSTQKAGSNVQQKANAVELQYDDSTADNVYAELCAYEAGTAIYQDIRTVPGTLYKVRLKHASLNSTYLDKMQVMIGTPGHEQPVEMTRTSVNGHGDKLNEKSTTIATKVTNGNNRHHADQWETYEGTYLIPDGQTTTRFTFKSIDAKQLDYGNVLDDIVFDKAYRLSYDKNASDATGKVPSNQRGKENTVQPAESKTTGNVKTVADNTSNLPDHLVNGTFDYRGNEIINENQRVYGSHDTTYLAIISAKTGIIGNPLHSKLDNWNSGKFGWKSNDDTAGADTVEVQRRNHTPYPTNAGNVWGEIAAAKRGKYIYQDIATTPGVVYKWSLKHASRNADQDDSMQVMIGEPGKTVAQQATRTTSNGSDKTGSAGTTITTHGTAQNGKWETYTGDYLATSTTTRFTFRSVRDSNGQGLDFTAEGNCVDDLSFDKAYKLSYDKNSSDATGSVPSNQYGKENTVEPTKAKTTGSVGLAADKTASGLTVHDLKNGEIAPVQYGDFKFSTIDGVTADQITDVNGFTVKTNWNPTVENQAYAGTLLGTMYQPNKNGASLVLHHVGQWRDSSGTQRWLNAKITVNGQNLGSLVYYESQHKFLASYGKWDRHTSSRPYMDVTVDFLLDDGSTPQGLRGVTGFTDLDGGTSGYNEGVELVSGFDGAYVRSDAHLARFGTNGWAGATDENENNADAHGMKHYVGATFTGSSFHVRWSVASGQARGSGFQPVDSTIAYRLTYDKNAQDATGSIPSDTAANTTQPAKSETDGKVSDLVQRTTTHEDGSVTVRTVDQSTDVVSGCQVYYPAGQRITLATLAKDGDCWDSSMLTRPGHTQLGWSQDSQATQAQAEVTMVEGGMTVYAVWVGNPVLTYDTNKPNTWNGQMPSTPASVSVPYNTAAADGSGWQSGDTSKIRGYRFLGWYAGPQDDAGPYDWNTLLTGNVTVYAHWQRLQSNVVYDANGGTGSHANTTGWQYSDVTVPSDTSKSFKRDGYVFLGWDTQADGNGTAYKDGSQVPLQDKDITLYAQWQPVFEQFTPTGGVSLPLLVAGGVTLLVMGIGSTVMLTRRMRGEQ